MPNTRASLRRRILDRTMRGRLGTNDEQGAAMVFVVVLVVVGFIITTGIAAASMTSIRQTTQGRSNVQAFAAAEAGRDSMAAFLSQRTPSCLPSDMTGAIAGASWTAKLFYKAGANQVPTGYAADGTPQGSGWSGSALCVDLATAPPGEYTVVVAATGRADMDGTTRLIDAVYPFVVTPPDKSIVAPTIGPFTMKGALGGNIGNVAHTGDVVITKPAGATGPTFTCGEGSEVTIIKGDVYVLDGDAEFRYPGCYITGDLYVAGNISVTGAATGLMPGQPAFENNVYPSQPKIFGYGDDGLAQARLLWVGGNVRVGGNLDEVNGMTVRGSVVAGGNVDLKCGLTKGLSEVNIGADLPANKVAILSGGTVNLRAPGACGLTSDPINGSVKAVKTVTAEGTRELAGTTWVPTWSIKGPVEAGGKIDISGVDAGAVSSPAAVDVRSGIVGPVTSGAAAMLMGTSSGPVRANGAVSVSNPMVWDATVKGVTAGGAISIDRSGGVGGSLTLDGAVKSAGGNISVSRGGTVFGDLTVKGDVTTPSGDVTVVRRGSGGGHLTLTGRVATGLGTVTVDRGGSDTGNLSLTGNVDAHGPLIVQRTGGLDNGTKLSITGNLRARGDVTITRTGAGLGDLQINGQVSTDQGSMTITRTDSNTGDVVMKGDVSAKGPVTITREGGAAGGRLSLEGAVKAQGNVSISRSGSLGGDLAVTGDVISAAGTVRVTRSGSDAAGLSVTGDVKATGNVVIDRADRGLSGRLKVDGTVESKGDVSQTGSQITGCVKADGNYTGEWNGYTEIGKCLWVRGTVKATTGGGDLINWSYVIGNTTVSPAVWAGGDVNLERHGGYLTDFGELRKAVHHVGSLSVGQTWRINGSDKVTTKPAVVTIPAASVPPVPQVDPLNPNPPVGPLPVAPVGPTAAELTTLADGTTVLDSGHWMDLSHARVRNAALSSGYQTSLGGESLTFAGADCKDGGFLGWGYSKASQAIAKALSAGPDAGPAPKYLIDTTGCTDRLNMKYNVALKVNSDVVLLVKNYRNNFTSTFFGGTSGTAANPRNIFVVQPDSQPDKKPTCNNSTDAAAADRARNLRTDEQSGRTGFDFDSAYGTEKISTMFYTPCGFEGVFTPSGASSRFFGQLFVGRQSSSIWNEFTCQPMQLGSPVAIELTCGEPMTGSGVAGTGGQKSYALTSDTPLLQTEPGS